MIKVFHGSNQIVKNPVLIQQNHTLDFGKGFYTTINEEQANSFALKVQNRRKIGIPCVNVFELDERAFEDCSFHEFKSADIEWLDFVSQNRN